ncbi:hypothetical protein [Gluconacetobacter entanii]|uniref:Uncharacterized protein n=1 Tax=Gluconacetobacter entanii TaxID=108528 RepID=A0A318PP83_9PROT|nr:hypothetical protein [Gluconacetobacter entanii]MCE2578093.1 hypothetical protein [Komagataeibacter sp. FNDCR1]PYD62290.1 hypothetical protein CFR72_13375 [Gluconacetobacter entanii]
MNDDLDNISITPRGIGALVAELGAGDGDGAFIRRLAQSLTNMGRSYMQRGYPDEDTARFLHEIAEGAAFRRKEMQLAAHIHHQPGHA